MKNTGDEFFMSMKDRKIYNKWRLRILISIILGYGTYYLCRQNFSMIMPVFMEEFGYSKTKMGAVLSIASIIYGIGKFFNGYISDKSNARYFMSIGLGASAAITLCMGFADSIYFLGFFWVINNWFQSMGWPPAARMLTHWFSQRELGTKWAIGAASHQVGGAITLVITGYLAANYGWRYAFFIPGAIALIVALFLFNRLRESPEKIGMPTVEQYKDDKPLYDDIEEEHLATKEIISRVFCNINIWYICLANMCVYIVRIGIIAWGPLFLKETKFISLEYAGWQVASYELNGLLGGFAAGWLSDKIGGNRGPVGFIFMLGLAASLTMFWYVPENQHALSAFILTIIGFFVYGPQVLVGVASADFASKKAVGTANGLAGTMGYVGSAISGICVGLLSDKYGWGSVYLFFIISSLFGAFFFALTWFSRVSKR